MQKEIRALQAQLLQAQTSFDHCHIALLHAAKANIALRRGCMIRDVQARSADFLQEQAMTGSAGYERKVTELVDTVANTHNTMIDDGIAQNVLTDTTAEYQYCSDKDRQWLRDNLHAMPFNAWLI